MKVPTLNTTRTQSPNLTQVYSQNRANPAAFGAGIGQAVAGLGGAIAGLTARFAEREEKTERFGALRNFSEFESQAAQTLTEMQRNADPSGKDFARQAEDQYDKEMNNFLNTKVPAHLQEEFSYRATETKKSIVGNALKFQYQAGDAFFRQGVSDEYSKALTAVDPRTGGTPDQMEAYKVRMAETIDATDLSEAEKAELKRNVNRGLEGAAYRAAVTTEGASGTRVKLPEGIGGIIDEAASRHGVDAATLRGIAWLESRGKAHAKNDKSSAGGLFQFIDDTAAAYGLKDRFDPNQAADAGARLLADNKAGLTRALGREPTPGELYLAHQQGLGGATKLLANPDARAIEVVGAAAIRLNGGHPDMTAQAFANLWIRKMEKTLSDSGTNLDTDPRFANVPFEDKIALREDAMRDLQAQQTAEAKAQKEAYSAALNSTLTGIHDGRAGRSDIDAFRAANPNMPFGDIQKMDAALKAYDEGAGLGAATLAKITGGGVIDPTDTNDKKGMNAIIGKDGLEKVGNMDAEYFTNSVVSLTQSAGDIPTNIVGTLTGMMRSNNQQRALFALDAFAQLQDADERAYNARVPKSVQDDVEFWRTQRNDVPHEELMKQLNPGLDAAQRQATRQLWKDAEDYLGTKVDKIPTLKTLVDNVVGSFDGWFTSAPQLSSLPWAASGLQADFQTTFIREYAKYGDVDKTVEATTKALKKEWTVTSVGLKRIMKYAPEQVGYKAYNGSYDWINDQIKTELSLPPDAKFELISDDLTGQEFEAWRAGADQPPSYKVGVMDKAGFMRVQDQRMYFQVPEEVKMADEIRINAQQELIELRQELETSSKVVQDAATLGQELDPVEVQELEEMRTRYQELRKQLSGDQPDTYEEIWERRMAPKLGSGGGF